VAEQPLFAAFVRNAGCHLDAALVTALHRGRGGQQLGANAVRGLLLASITKLLDDWPALHTRLRMGLNTKLSPALRAVCWTAVLQIRHAADTCVWRHT
jgi:hypothetical protein